MWNRDLSQADGYYRVSSTKQQKFGHALERYRQDLLRIGIPEERIFHDVASGADASRPGYQELFNRVRAGTTKKIVIPDLSRLSRDPEEWERAMRELSQLGVKIETADGIPIDISTPEGAYTARQNMAAAAYVREKNKYAAKKGWDHLKLMGRAHNAPFGYSIKGYQYILNQDSEVVKWIFDTYRSCGSGRETLRLMLRHWKGYQAVSGWGMPTTHKGIMLLLKNPIFMGLSRDGVKAPQIVSVEEFREVQSMISSSTPRRQAKVQSFPAQGLIRCAQCGASMSGRMMTPDKKRYPDKVYGYYLCYLAHQSKRERCQNSRGIPFSDAHSAIILAITKAADKVALFATRASASEPDPEIEKVRKKLDILGSDPDFEDSRKKLLAQLKTLEDRGGQESEEKQQRRQQLGVIREVVGKEEFWASLPQEKLRRYFLNFVDSATGLDGRIEEVRLKPLL